ncbi:MAG: exodeoxyribonuclease VII large subunit [Deltaproteobacteria bacterium]|nr:exodeoxyribonuclease VII large subunit [Deltaproteobacteria bacterium]
MKIYSVSEISREIKGLLEENFSDLWIGGEISNFRPASSGHYYFSLKDEKSQIRAVMFRGSNQLLKFQLENGLSVVCYGRISVYEPRGEYQVIVEMMEPKGIGSLQLAFEQLKKKLEAEGLFEASRKREIPFLPRKIGIVTSPTGAVIRDMIHVLTRRFPNIQILLNPVLVQGEGAAGEIAKAIEELNEHNDIDILIVGRGGGSMEDLWAFNEEVVARAIAASRIPVISAVGHETDFTIADFVADLRAPTPSAAAELAVPVKRDLLATVIEHQGRLLQAIEQRFENLRLLLRQWEGYFSDPGRRLTEALLRVDHLREQMSVAMSHQMEFAEEKLKSLSRHLAVINPKAILSRGYAIAFSRVHQKALRYSHEAKAGDLIDLQLYDGTLVTEVTGEGK